MGPRALAAPRGMKWVSRVLVGPGGLAPLIHQCETLPVGIYPSMECYCHHPGQQMACRDEEGAAHVAVARE